MSNRTPVESREGAFEWIRWHALDAHPHCVPDEPLIWETEGDGGRSEIFVCPHCLEWPVAHLIPKPGNSEAVKEGWSFLTNEELRESGPPPR
jgi:hypothetical protein